MVRLSYQSRLSPQFWGRRRRNLMNPLRLVMEIRNVPLQYFRARSPQVTCACKHQGYQRSRHTTRQGFPKHVKLGSSSLQS